MWFLGSSEDEVVEMAVGTYGIIMEELQKVNLPIAPAKTEVMATSEAIRERIWKIFPFDKEKKQLRQLGVDITMDQGRLPRKGSARAAKAKDGKGIPTKVRKWTLKVRNDRAKIFRARALKCGRIFNGKNYAKIAQAGLLPGVLFGCDMAEVPLEQMTTMRRVLAQAKGIRIAGAYNEWPWLMEGARVDPMFQVYAATVIRWARELWYTNRSTLGKDSHNDAMSGKEIVQVWEALQKEDPKAMVIAWMQKCFRELEVRMVKPTIWAIEEDEIDVLVSTKPRLLAWMAARWEKRLWKEICAKGKTPVKEIRIKELQKVYRKGTAGAKRVMLQLLADKLYTRQEACRMGAECNAECALCNGKTDTIQHRLSECCRGPQIEDTKTRRDYKEVLFQGDVWPEVLMRDRNVGDFEYGIVTRIGEDLYSYKTCPAFIFMMGVIIYTDGSCWFSNSRFARGSGAAVQRITEEEGEVYRTVSWMVPESMMQCSFTGEWIGFPLAILHHGQDSHRMEAMTDSAALLRELRMQPARRQYVCSSS